MLKKKLGLLVVGAAFMALSSSVMAQDAMGSCPEWEGMSAELQAACNGDYSGTAVTMTGPFVDADEVKFNDSVTQFEEWTGIDIQYTGTKEFEVAIVSAVDGGAAPDIADFPQPGLLANFASKGQVTDLSAFMNADWLTANYAQSWLDYGTMEGPDGPMTAGVWARYNAKSQVFYAKDDFDAAGYTIPTTWDELMALSDQIVADGSSPWCVGLESGAATGWTATDWMEEIMLRTTSLDNYDNWTVPATPEDRLLFTSPEVKNAAEILGSVWFKDNYVSGGRDSIAVTSFGDAPAGLFTEPPNCYMHKQGNFISSFFPPDSVYGEDWDVFYLPGIDEEFGSPYLIAGDIYAMFNDRPEVRAVMDFFSRGDSLTGWLATGGTLAPQNDAVYTTPADEAIAALVANSTSVRFDGSDLMPGAVGSGSFWTGMTNWVSGTVDLDTALAEIDAAWPAGN